MFPSLSEYLSAAPFPHCVVDGFFPEGLLDSVVSEWPVARHKKVGGNYKKNIGGDVRGSMRQLVDRLNGDEFVGQLKELTGIKDLFADELLFGGGPHEVPPGGFLKHHVDFNYNEHISGIRRVNLLLYLNRDWKENGDLELLDEDGKVVKSISPIFNRMVIFTCSEKSWHGHPTPLTGDRSRLSLALYYYSPGKRPKDYHSTIYRG